MDRPVRGHAHPHGASDGDLHVAGGADHDPRAGARGAPEHGRGGAGGRGLEGRAAPVEAREEDRVREMVALEEDGVDHGPVAHSPCRKVAVRAHEEAGVAGSECEREAPRADARPHHRDARTHRVRLEGVRPVGARHRPPEERDYVRHLERGVIGLHSRRERDVEVQEEGLRARIQNVNKVGVDGSLCHVTLEGAEG